MVDLHGDTGGRIARYVADRPGIALMALSPQIQEACVSECARGKAFAEGISPRSSEETRAYFRRRYGSTSTVRYADSFEVVPSAYRARAGLRVAALLRNSSPQAAAVEFGNAANRRPQRVLGRTAAFLAGGS